MVFKEIMFPVKNATTQTQAFPHFTEKSLGEVDAVISLAAGALCSHHRIPWPVGVRG